MATIKDHNPDLPEYVVSRERGLHDEDPLLRDRAFNRHSMNDGHHVSPFAEGHIDIGLDNLSVRLVQGIDEEAFKRTLSRAQQATIGLPATGEPDTSDWDEMLKGGLQTALETQTIVFEVHGVARATTHQIVRSRRAAFHQQSMRASWFGARPNTRMPESIWRNDRARGAYLRAVDAAHDAYAIACEEDISYQDARYVLPIGTETYIMCEYTVREFLAVYAYRACSMFQWEICHVVREMGRLLSDEYPWLEPYIKISCQDRPCSKCGGRGKYLVRSVEFPVGENEEWHTCDRCHGTRMEGSKCTFQGWEQVEEQCGFAWAKEELRTFQPNAHLIESIPRKERPEDFGPEDMHSEPRRDTVVGNDPPVGDDPVEAFVPRPLGQVRPKETGELPDGLPESVQQALKEPEWNPTAPRCPTCEGQHKNDPEKGDQAACEDPFHGPRFLCDVRVDMGYRGMVKCLTPLPCDIHPPGQEGPDLGPAETIDGKEDGRFEGWPEGHPVREALDKIDGDVGGTGDPLGQERIDSEAEESVCSEGHLISDDGTHCARCGLPWPDEDITPVPVVEEEIAASARRHPSNFDPDVPDEDKKLAEALSRLRWVVPGRDYADSLIADVQTVLAHFGMTNAHGGG